MANGCIHGFHECRCSLIIVNRALISTIPFKINKFPTGEQPIPRKSKQTKSLISTEFILNFYYQKIKKKNFNF